MLDTWTTIKRTAALALLSLLVAIPVAEPNSEPRPEVELLQFVSKGASIADAKEAIIFRAEIMNIHNVTVLKPTVTLGQNAIPDLILSPNGRRCYFTVAAHQYKPASSVESLDLKLIFRVNRRDL